LTLNYGISILQSRLQQYKTIGFTDYSVGIYFAHSITWSMRSKWQRLRAVGQLNTTAVSPPQVEMATSVATLLLQKSTRFHSW